MSGPSDPGSRSATGTGQAERVGPAKAGGQPVAFDAQADVYDKVVNALPRYHDHLRSSARRMGLSGRGLRLLDVGCGTGASTAALLDAAPGSEVVAVDASAAMLGQARRKNWPPNVTFVHASLEDLAGAGVSGPFDGIFAAYLVRNLADLDDGLRTLHGLLRPGAPLAVHEYSVRHRLGSKLRWSGVSWSLIIPLGRMRGGSGELYRQQWRSVLDFDGAPEFAGRLKAAGFDDVRVQTVGGWQQNILYTFLGRRPEGPAVEPEAAGPAVEAGGPAGGVGGNDVPTPPEGLPVPPAEPPTPPVGNPQRPGKPQ